MPRRPRRPTAHPIPQRASPRTNPPARITQQGLRRHRSPPTRPGPTIRRLTRRHLRRRPNQSLLATRQAVPQGAEVVAVVDETGAGRVLRLVRPTHRQPPTTRAIPKSFPNPKARGVPRSRRLKRRWCVDHRSGIPDRLRPVSLPLVMSPVIHPPRPVASRINVRKQSRHRRRTKGLPVGAGPRSAAVVAAVDAEVVVDRSPVLPRVASPSEFVPELPSR